MNIPEDLGKKARSLIELKTQETRESNIGIKSKLNLTEDEFDAFLSDMSLTFAKIKTKDPTLRILKYRGRSECPWTVENEYGMVTFEGESLHSESAQKLAIFLGIVLDDSRLSLYRQTPSFVVDRLYLSVGLEGEEEFELDFDYAKEKSVTKVEVEVSESNIKFLRGISVDKFLLFTRAFLVGYVLCLILQFLSKFLAYIMES